MAAIVTRDKAARQAALAEAVIRRCQAAWTIIETAVGHLLEVTMRLKRCSGILLRHCARSWSPGTSSDWIAKLRASEMLRESIRNLGVGYMRKTRRKPFRKPSLALQWSSSVRRCKCGRGAPPFRTTQVRMTGMRTLPRTTFGAVGYMTM